MMPSSAGLRLRGVEFASLGNGSSNLDDFLDLWNAKVIRSLTDFDVLVGRSYRLVRECVDGEDQHSLRRLFHHCASFRILCLTRVLGTGADQINAVLSRVAAGVSRFRNTEELMPGEPVMMQVNDYQRMIFNGDQGLVLRVSEKGSPHLVAVFPRSAGFAVFHLESLRPVLLRCFAMTVHMAQGSEFDLAALVLPDRDLPIATREILYTAITRCRAGVTILGDRGIFARAVARPIDRNSGIGEKLLGRGGSVR